MSWAAGTYALALCDRCGRRVSYHDRKKEWTNLLVCKECYEPKHPQLDPRPVRADAEALRDARPEAKEPVYVYVGPNFMLPNQGRYQCLGIVGAAETELIPVETMLFPISDQMVASVGTVTITSDYPQASVAVNVNGFQTSGGVGPVSTLAGYAVSVTGVVGTTGVGTPNVPYQVGGTGTAAEPGSVQVVGKAVVSPTGIAATGGVGTVQFNTTVTGVSGTGQGGSPTVSLGPHVSVTGTSGTGQPGAVIVYEGSPMLDNDDSMFLDNDDSILLD